MVVSKHLLVPGKRTLGVDKPCKPAAPFCRAHRANIFQAIHFVKRGRLVGDVRNDYGGPNRGGRRMYKAATTYVRLR